MTREMAATPASESFLVVVLQVESSPKYEMIGLDDGPKEEGKSPLPPGNFSPSSIWGNLSQLLSRLVEAMFGLLSNLGEEIRLPIPYLSSQSPTPLPPT